MTKSDEAFDDTLSWKREIPTEPGIYLARGGYARIPVIAGYFEGSGRLHFAVLRPMGMIMNVLLEIPTEWEWMTVYVRP